MTQNTTQASQVNSVPLSLQEEVEKVVSLLQEQARSLSRHGLKKHLRVLPMYSGLPYADQMKVFERVPHSVRKVLEAVPVTSCFPPALHSAFIHQSAV